MAGAVVVAEYTVSCTVITAAPITTTNPSKHGGDARQAAKGAAAGFPSNSRDSGWTNSPSKLAERRSGKSSTVNERIARARHVSNSSSWTVDWTRTIESTWPFTSPTSNFTMWSDAVRWCSCMTAQLRIGSEKRTGMSATGGALPHPPLGTNAKPIPARKTDAVIFRKH
jgi:hypothetical protein